MELTENVSKTDRHHYNDAPPHLGSGLRRNDELSLRLSVACVAGFE